MSPKKKVKSSKIHLEDTVCQDTHDASDRYKKVSHAEHVLLRPEMYIGSMEHHLLQKVPLLKPDVRPILLPKLMKAGPDFDTAFVQLNGGPSVRLRGNFSEEDSEFDENEVPYLNDEFTKEGSENEFAKDADKKELDEEELQSLGESVSDDGLEDGESVVDDGFEDGESAPLIDGKILGVDARLCDTSQKYNAERILGPGSFYYRDVWMHPGLLKIFDEVIVNAADNRLTTPSDGATHQTFIKVFFDKESGRITVANDGNGIPIVKHKDHDLWIPEMIFGHLLTSSHYENDPNSVAAGRHGYGAKLTNIMSSEFTVTCHWKDKVFVGKWSDNMSRFSIDVNEGLPVSSFKTEISFVPDYDRFLKEDNEKRQKFMESREKGVAVRELSVFPPEGFDVKGEFMELIRKRCLDLAASIGTRQKVYFNDVCLTPKSFGNYCRMYFPEKETDRQPFIVEKRGVKLGILMRDPATIKNANIGTEGDTPHISLVNGVSTPQGGVHLVFAENMISNTLDFVAATLMERGRVIFDIESFRKNLIIFISVIVPQPKFDSQSKLKLVSKHTFLSAHRNLTLADHILSLPFLNKYCVSADTIDRKFLDAVLSGRLSSNRVGMVNIPKLVEPTKILDPTVEKTLILTEGDSASTLAISSLSIEQRSTFGVLPLRGKVLNVRAHPLRKLANNVELMNLFLAMGLRINEETLSVSNLRYQRIMIMTDQDHDGLHIRGLLLNLFDLLWPKMMEKNPGFISIFSTPIVKVTLPSGKEHQFFTTKQYDEWIASCDSKTLATVKRRYYKGLGTSSTDEGKVYFSNMESATTKIIWNEYSGQSLVDFFDPFTVATRKARVRDFVPSEQTCQNASATVSDFVNKDLLNFVFHVNYRALPTSTDGLKASNRKVLWALLKRDPPAMRVSQLAGYVSEVSNYHHGEVSLYGVIIKLAQDFTTSNNINLLEPEGQFGSRLGGGADSAAPRYIFTKLSRFARLIFPKADDALLEYQCVDGDDVEPFSYAPVVPLALVNGASSIGYGMYCKIPSHHPLSIINCTKRLVCGETALEVYQPCSLSHIPVGFRGSVMHIEGRLHYVGKVDIYEDDGKLAPHSLLPKRLTLRVTELPPDQVSSQFIDYIRGKFEKKLLYIHDYCGGDHIDIEFSVDTAFLIRRMRTPTEQSLIEFLGLHSPVPFINGEVISGCSNTIVKASLVSIVEEHFKMRLSVYEKRYAAIKKSYKREIERIDSTIRFTELIRSDLSLLRLSEEKLSQKLKSEGISEAVVNDEEIVNENVGTALETSTSNSGYSYLTKRPVSTLLRTNLDGLRQRLKSCQERLANFEENVTVNDLWLKDLSALETEFLRFEKKKNAAIDGSISARKMNKRRIVETYTDKNLPMLPMLPSYSAETNSITNVFDIFRKEMENKGWEDNSKWTRRVSVLKKRAIQQRKEERLRISEAKNALRAARRERFREQLRDKMLSEQIIRDELSLIKERAGIKRQLLEELNARKKKIFENCTSSEFYIMTDHELALLEEIARHRQRIMNDEIFINESKSVTMIEGPSCGQSVEKITTGENILSDGGVSSFINESTKIDSLINEEIDATMKEINEVKSVAIIEGPSCGQSVEKITTENKLFDEDISVLFNESIDVIESKQRKKKFNVMNSVSVNNKRSVRAPKANHIVNQLKSTGKVTANRPSSTTKVTANRPSSTSKVTANRPSSTSKVTANRPSKVTKVTANRPSKVSRIARYRLTKSNKLVNTKGLRKDKKHKNIKRISSNKTASRAKTHRSESQIARNAPSKSKSTGASGKVKKAPEEPHKRIGRIAEGPNHNKRTEYIKIVKRHQLKMGMTLNSKPQAPLTAPFSPMTAPLFTIHPMDTFTLVNAAVAHRTFAWRQHMTTLVRQRVGAIGTPVLGRLISRFIF